MGSNVLTTPKGKLDITRLSAIVDQIAWLKEHRYEVILVTSGAVACGRSELKVDFELDTVEQRQLFSAIGQVKLINLYYQLFREHGLHIGQILTMKENFMAGQQYDNQKACMEVMLDNGVIPVVNENDTVCVTELMFTDNDELSGLIAGMIGARTLVLLSNIDGVYTGNPSDPASQLIRHVKPTDCLDGFIQQSKSPAGRGGMASKYNTARTVAAKGIRVVIANGTREHILTDILEKPSETPFTEFIPS